MSLCDVCLSPGACCQRMALSSSLIRRVWMPGGEGRAHDPMSRDRAEHLMIAAGLPFIPSHQQANGVWRYGCTQLQPNGRCGAYEERPQVCRDFKPGSDPLCVHSWAEGGDSLGAAA